MSAGLWQTPLPPSVARSRLISNVAAIVLSIFCRTLFSPYLAIRSVVVSLLDKIGLPGSSLVWWTETLVTATLVLNVLEAAYWVAYPPPEPKPAGPSLQPLAKSSPLTRSYPPTPDFNETSTMPLAHSPLGAAVASFRTPVKGQGQPSTPVRSALNQSLGQSLSGRTGSPSSGLFYDPDSAASPAKVALSLSQRGKQTPTQQPAQPQKQEKKDGFVLVDREEKEWVDNVWKGVRGKAGRMGL